LKTKPENGSSPGKTVRVVLSGKRSGCDLHKGVQELAHTKIVDGAAEEDRSLASFEEILKVKRVGRPLQQGHVLPQFIGLAAQDLVQYRIAEVPDGDTVVGEALPAGREKGQFPAVDVVCTFESFAHADGPG